MRNLLFKTILTIVSIFQASFLLAEGLSVNGIVATVNGEPITLNDLNERLGLPHKLSMQEAATSSEAKEALDQMIQERLISEEAKLRRVVVTDEEVEAYLDELATRNGLSREAFEQVYKEQKKQDISVFKKEIETQILKSKLAGDLIRGSSAVTDTEIENYIKDHPEYKHETSKIKLAQILLKGNDLTVVKLARKIHAQLVEDPDLFEELAEKYSQSPEAENGGVLGELNEKDLDPTIFDAIFSLHEGDISSIILSPDSCRIFKVIERYTESADEEITKKTRDEVEQILKQEKLELRLRDYFNIDLFTNHFVDRKI